MSSVRETCFWRAINLRSVQNASSRLTLVLWPLMTADRLMIGDFMERRLGSLITVVCWQSLELLLKGLADFGARNLARWPDAHALADASVVSRC